MELSAPRPTDFLYKLVVKKIYYARAPVETFVKYHTSQVLGERESKRSPEFTPKVKALSVLSNEELGAQGERACRYFLDALCYAYGNLCRPEHVNDKVESFKPYDISINNYIFIDVKTTRSEEETLFHLSLPEATFLCSKPQQYLIARVFPLEQGKIYQGIQLSSSWGMNLYKLKREHISDLQAMVSEMTIVTRGEGFMIRTIWLDNFVKGNELSIMEGLLFNIKIADAEHLRNTKQLTRDSPLGAFKGALIVPEMDSMTDAAYQYKVYQLLLLLHTIIARRGTKDYNILLKENNVNHVLNIWDNKTLDAFISDCEYLDYDIIHSIMY